MVQRNPELRAARRVAKRDGRLVPFDRQRLQRSLCAALSAAGREEPTLAADLASVVLTCLEARAPEETVGAAELAELVAEVLTGAGCELAASAYRAARGARQAARAGLRIRGRPAGEAVRGIPAAAPGQHPDDEWSKGRIVALLSAEAELGEELAGDVAADVERGLFASGLRSVSAGLLREWIDNELELRGLAVRLGRHPFVGLPPRELREVLAAGAAGHAAESDLAGRLLARYALREVYPEPVAAAHQRGVLQLESLSAGARLDALTVAPWSLPALAAARRPERMRRLAPLLSELCQIVARELVLVWDGPALDAGQVADLYGVAAAGALPSAAVTTQLVLQPATDAPAAVVACLEGHAAAVTQGGRRPEAVLRLSAEHLPEELLTAALEREAVDPRVQFVAGPAQAGRVPASVVVNVARVALAAGPRRVHEFLAGLDALFDLALAALAAHAALAERDSSVAAVVATVTGLPAQDLPESRRLALCGVAEATVALLGDGPTARANRLDLAAAVGERLAARLARSSAAAGTGRVPGTVAVGLAGSAAARRLGRLDLAAFSEARDRLPLARDRQGFRYDGAYLLAPGADPAEAGREAGRLRHLLGVTELAAVPRSTGGTAQRRDFLQGFLSLRHSAPELHPCG